MLLNYIFKRLLNHLILLVTYCVLNSNKQFYLVSIQKLTLTEKVSILTFFNIVTRKTFECTQASRTPTSVMYFAASAVQIITN